MLKELFTFVFVIFSISLHGQNYKLFNENLIYPHPPKYDISITEYVNTGTLKTAVMVMPSISSRIENLINSKSDIQYRNIHIRVNLEMTDEKHFKVSSVSTLYWGGEKGVLYNGDLDIEIFSIARDTEYLILDNPNNSKHENLLMDFRPFIISGSSF